jgi:hypothetical protein
MKSDNGKTRCKENEKLSNVVDMLFLRENYKREYKTNIKSKIQEEKL